MKALKVAGILAVVAVGALLLLVLSETTLFSDQLFNLYTGRLDKWVSSGGPASSVQSDVVENCGNIAMSQAGFFGFLSMYTFDRAELNFQVDVCAKMTANRVYKQPEFENPKTVQLLCDGTQQLFRRFCSMWGLKSGDQ